MFFAWTVGFIIPWIHERNVIWITAPIAIAVSCVFNMLGFGLGFWSFTPATDPETLFGLPVDTGLYPVTASFGTFALRHNLRWWTVVVISALFLTSVEGIGVLLHYIHYGNGWNIVWTVISYTLGDLVVVGYIRLVSSKSFRHG